MRKNRDAELAKSLHGTNGRLFVHVDGETWKDTDTGHTGPRAELEDAFLAELQARDAEAEASRDVAAYWQASAGGQPKPIN